ncbi:hypothetical protein PYW08_012965 [Mythimna loreyi]|uniref:Uncharacterized protein n=1 Tax=Mythimna loreyi TaxID=667449 RepID=A0ACC2PYZ9_9NEOP|nr:hypothetical protein PYW08_012965 [Mythimna loreyi]
MGRHKRRHKSESSSSSSSGSDHNINLKRKYKKKFSKNNERIAALESLVREMRRKNISHQDSSVEVVRPSTPVIRYVGRNDFIPEFDPQTSSISIEHWIRNLEGISKMHGWDERTLICNCTSKLRGYAKAWYERQAVYEMSWSEWKDKLIKAFPFTKNKLAQIRELVNKIRLPTENPIEFYYNKLGIGMSCQLSDEIITQAIIGTLGDKLLEVGALSAGCQDTTSLLKYLASFMNSDNSNVETKSQISMANTNKAIKCFKCGKEGHKAHVCTRSRKTNVDKKCSFCDKPGHVEATCYKKKNLGKFCSFCKNKGHVVEECRRRSAALLPDKTVRKVQTVSSE